MWQSRSPLLVCFCWILMTDNTDADDTMYVTQGSQTVLQCPLSSVINNIVWFGPPGDIPYNLEGKTTLNPNLPVDFLSRLAVNPTTGALIINNTQRSDDNWYTCKKYGNLSHVKLTVTVPPQPPLIANNFEDNGIGRMVVWAVEDSKISLVCQVIGGNPQPSVKWIRGGVTGSVISASNTVQSNTDGSYNVTSVTTITAGRSEDRMIYICQATHATWALPKTASLELYLYFKPSQPVLSKQGSLQEGGNLSIKCSVTGSRPAANLMWTGSQGYQIQTNTWIPEDETYNSTLLFTKTVNRQDNGVSLLCTLVYTALGSIITTSTTLLVLCNYFII